MHRFDRHIDKVVLALWLRDISVCNFQDDRSSFFLDMLEEILGRVEDIQQEVNRFFFLGAIEKLERSVAASHTSNVLAVDLEVVCKPTESQSVFPANPNRVFSTVSKYLDDDPTYMSLANTI